MAAVPGEKVFSLTCHPCSSRSSPSNEGKQSTDPAEATSVFAPFSAFHCEAQEDGSGIKSIAPATTAPGIQRLDSSHPALAVEGRGSGWLLTASIRGGKADSESAKASEEPLTSGVLSPE